MRISTQSKTLAIAASLLLLTLYVLPLWKIDLLAPQYPEGLGLVIRATTITGRSPNDLSTINGLNHYIGMKEIDPGAVPELRIMPWAIAGLVAFGLAAAFSGRKWALQAWLASFAVAGAAGMVQFWRWGYDYGHNLSPDAIIKVPGMAYQPPLIGTKQLLNFTASSWPAVGGYVAGVAFVTGVVAVWLAMHEARLAGKA